MSVYTPDAWVIVRFTKGAEVTDKVLGGWYGGYGGSDSWRISSGITDIVEKDEHYLITNHSGSEYRCYRGAERMSGVMSSEYNQWMSIVDKQSHDVGHPAHISVEIVKMCDLIRND